MIETLTSILIPEANSRWLVTENPDSSFTVETDDKVFAITGMSLERLMDFGSSFLIALYEKRAEKGEQSP